MCDTCLASMAQQRQIDRRCPWTNRQQVLVSPQNEKLPQFPPLWPWTLCPIINWSGISNRESTKSPQKPGVKAFRFPIKILKRQALHFDARFKLTSTFEQLKVKFDFEPNVSESRKNIKCMNVHGRSAGALEWEISQKDSKLKASAMCLKSKNKPPWRGYKTKLFPSKHIWMHFKVREIIMFDFASYARRTIDVWDEVGRENGENEHWLMIWSGGRGKKQCKYSEPGMMVFLSACPGFIIHSLLLLYSHFPFYWNDAIKCLPLIYHSSIFTFTFIVFFNYLLFFFIQSFYLCY